LPQSGGIVVTTERYKMEITFEESGAPLKKSRNRKGETCEEQLRRMVKDIAMGINSPEEGETASSWMGRHV
jgi:hypothetical protein